MNKVVDAFRRPSVFIETPENEISDFLTLSYTVFIRLTAPAWALIKFFDLESGR